MAAFLEAYKVVKFNEGGYRNVSWDKGGETYKGIARNYWPKWEGWKIVDAYKKKYGPLKTNQIIKDPVLDGMVHKFFEVNFYIPNNIHLIVNQTLANLVFDFVMNSGKGPVKIMEAVASKYPFKYSGTKVTKATIDIINRYPEQCYKLISAARVKYIESIKSLLGPDYIPVLNRAKSFLDKYEPFIVSFGFFSLAAMFFF